MSRTKGQRRHDMREGPIPKYVDSEKTVFNSTIISPSMESDLRSLCLERRALNPKVRAMKRDAAISTVGIITFGTEAQPIVNALEHATQNRLFSETTTRIAELLRTEISGLVVHRDESALHAHFQMPAFNYDGVPLSKVITPAVAKRMQDIAGDVFAAHGIHRGKAKTQRIADGDPLHTIVHRNVQQLHADLPRELEAASAKVEEVKAKIQNYERLIEENKSKLEAGNNDESKIQKRIAIYEQRIENMRDTEREIAEKKREIEKQAEKIREAQETLNANTQKLLKNAKIIAQQKIHLDAEKTSWQTPGAKIGSLLKTVKKSLSNDDEIEQLKNKITELEQRTARAVRVEAARWEPALKTARDDTRYAEMRRADAESALRAAEKKLAELEQRMRPDRTYKNDFKPR
jgi:hypothetical protein